MKRPWEARRDDLVEALRILDLVSPQAGNPSSDFFIIESPNDGTISMRVAGGSVGEVDISGLGIWPYTEPFYLDRRIFSPFVSVAKEIKNKNPFQFTAGDRLVIQHGKRRAAFDPQPTISGYASLGTIKKTNRMALTTEIVSLMKCAATCAESAAQNPVLACVFLSPIESGMNILTTNGKVVFRAIAKLDTPITSAIPFPLPMMSVIESAGLKSIRWGSNCVIGRFETGTVWQTVIQEAAEQFPVQDMLNTLREGRSRDLTVFQASAYRFARVIERLAMYLQSVKKEDWVMTLSGKKGKETIMVTAKMPGSVVRETVTVLGTLQKDFIMEWPLDMMNSVFQFVGKDKEDVALRVGLEKNGERSYVRCGSIEMIVPARSI